MSNVHSLLVFVVKLEIGEYSCDDVTKKQQ